MVNSCNPDIVILTKTRVSGDCGNSIINGLGFQRYLKVDAIGFSGGIWVLWNPNTITVEPIATAFHEVFLKVQASNGTFILTAIYASPIFAIRKLLWEKSSIVSKYVRLP